MLFLVRGEWVEVGALIQPEHMAMTMEKAVIPSIEMLAGWERDGSARGVILTGERAGAWIMEAGSAEELDRKLCELPFWGMIHWDIKSLMPSRSAVERDQTGLERLREMIGQMQAR
jgi:hypothetical protein